MRRIIGALALVCGACGGSSPVAPASAPAPLPLAALSPAVAPSLPILLAGQSNASLLRDVLPAGPNVVQGGTGIAAWAPDQPLGRELAQDARQRLSAFVWWQGEHDGDMSVGAYQNALQAILEAVRGGSGLPVRLIEPWHDGPDTAPVTAQRALAAAGGDVVFIPTADLPHGEGAHFAPEAYPVVRDRVYRSLRP